MSTLKDIPRWFASAGGAAALLVPKGLCPICVAASGGMLTSLGLGFLLVERNVRWMLGVSLAIGLTGFVLSARRHRRWWTVGLGVAAAGTTMTGRLLLEEGVLCGGMVLLVVATAADVWARRHPWAPLVQIKRREVPHA